jgi:hypothetical protein
MARNVFAGILALALTGPVLAGPAAAQSSGAYYHAVVEKPAAPGSRVISSDVVWSASGDAYDAPVAGDIPKRVCATLAQKAGPIVAFTAENSALSAEDLAYCNKHARKMK